jgi:hypothetical protein
MNIVCPHCNKDQDASYSVEHKDYMKPDDNDFNVCAYCGGVSLFCNKGNSLRKISDTDKQFLKENQEVFNKITNISVRIKNDIKLSSLKVFNKSFTSNLN